ncbi:hypothetical protein KDW23_00935 [Burkholderia cenocepacia]|uniref:hypothetical protein n=1 Tax=Burkholderia cenocepacia TaxID=95486 RepID=UPI001B94647F|nr:hypothetical protein [Burkholderia cenocepacia]MBR8443260.1 hypothetical protein [Burkholderia cenocepacia]
MDKIMHTRGPFHVSGTGRNLHIGSLHSPMVLASLNEVHIDTPANAQLFAAAPELATALRLVASKTVLTSGIRAVVDAALDKAGYSAPVPATDPVRHVRICGEGL